MKKYVFFILILFAIPSLFAQRNENKIFGYIGVSSTNFSGLYSDNRNYWSSGTSLGLGIDLSINERVSFLSNIEFSYLPLNERNVKKTLKDLNVNSFSIRIVGGPLYMFNITSNIKYKILTSKIITPYLITGLGYFVRGNDDSRVMSSVITPDGNEINHIALRFNLNEEGFSSNFGAGFEVDFNSKFGMFLDLQYFIGFTDDLSTSIPFRMGITYKL